MAITKITDHTEAALARLCEQFKDKPNIVALLTALTGSMQELEDALWQLLVERSLETAVGAQLDALGKIVKQERAGLGDTEYKRYINARIKTNRASGRIEEVITIADLIINDPTVDMEIEPQYPATVVMRILNIELTDDVAEILISFLRDVVSAGVRIILEYASIEEGDLFIWDTPGQGWDQGQFIPAIE